MINDLKLIKNKYGEKMMHFCRECFPTILETPGLLFKLLSDNFDYNKYLYDDIIEEYQEQAFKNYIYSLIDVEKKEIVVNKSPKELLSEVGYILYECKTEEDIQKFKKYYAENEELCTFRGGRLKNCYVFFAIKENVDEIKRENFDNPTRQDEYGTSVISIQFSKGNKNSVSIKNRYNHRVNNPDATFNNNLDNIIDGLTKSFEMNYSLNIYKKTDNDFELSDYIMADDGKYYKYTYEINNVYYCMNNIIIDNYEVIDKYQEKEKYIVFDHFILDLENKTIKEYDESISDSFVSCFKNINKIEVNKEKESKNRIIYLYFDDNKSQTIKINDKNQIVYYKNDYIYRIEENFLYSNETLKEIDIPNVVEIGNNFLLYNEKIRNLSFPKVMKIGDRFLLWNREIESIDFPVLESVGTEFLHYNHILSKLNLPNLKIAGSQFLFTNYALKELDLPNLMHVGHDFLYNNVHLSKMYLPNLYQVGNDFMAKNDNIIEINLPRLRSAGSNFFYSNKNKITLFLPRLEKVTGNDFLRNSLIDVLDLPSLIEVSGNFLYFNTTLKKLNVPKLKCVGENFLQYAVYYEIPLKNKIIKIINRCKKEEQKILKLEKKKNGN